MKNNKFLISIIIMIMGIPSLAHSQDQWEEVTYPEPRTLSSLFVTSKGSVLAGNGGEIVRSTDQGASWNEVASNGRTHLAADFVELNDGKLFTAGWDGVFVSDNDGENWSCVANCRAIGIEKDEQENLYISAEEPNCVYLSTNKGQNWRNISPGINSLDHFRLGVANSNRLVVSSGKDVFYSTDKGTSWYEANTSQQMVFTRIVSINNRLIGYSFFHSAFKGIFESFDGNNWTLINPNLPIMFLEGICSDEFNNRIIGWDPYKIIFSTDFGKNWFDISQGLPANTIITYIAAGKDGCMYTTTANNKVYRRKLILSSENKDGSELMTGLKCYPNPTTGDIHIDMGSYLTKVSKIELYDLNGTQVCAPEFSYHSGNVIYVSAEGIPPGTYYIRLQFGSSSAFLTLIIRGN